MKGAQILGLVDLPEELRGLIFNHAISKDLLGRGRGGRETKKGGFSISFLHLNLPHGLRYERI